MPATAEIHRNFNRIRFGRISIDFNSVVIVANCETARSSRWLPQPLSTCSQASCPCRRHRLRITSATAADRRRIRNRGDSSHYRKRHKRKRGRLEWLCGSCQRFQGSMRRRSMHALPAWRLVIPSRHGHNGFCSIQAAISSTEGSGMILRRTWRIETRMFPRYRWDRGR